MGCSGSRSRFWGGVALHILVVFFLLTSAGWGQTPPPTATVASPAPPAQEKILNDITQTLQQQIKELTDQLAQAQDELKKTQDESRTLGVAISTHKAALSLDKITLEQAKELQQYYAGLAEQKGKAVAALTPDLEKYTKIQGELTEATKKSQGRDGPSSQNPSKNRGSASSGATKSSIFKTGGDSDR